MSRNILYPQNLFKNSEILSSISWVKNTGVTFSDVTSDIKDPLGTNRASKCVYDGTGIVEDYRFYYAGSSNYSKNKTYTFSFWARTSSGTKNLRFSNYSTPYSSITLTTVWNRFSVTFTASGDFAQQPLVLDGGGSNSPFTIYFFGLQNEQANCAGEYFATTGSINTIAPRNKYANRNQNALRNILPELQNLVLYSNDFTQASWVKTWSNTVAKDTDMLPDGTTIGRVYETTGTNTHGIGQTIASFNIGRTYTISIIAKAGTHTWLAIGPAGGGMSAWFNLATGVLGTYTAGLSPNIRSVGNGFYECALTFVATALNTTSFYFYIGSANSTAVFLGNSSNYMPMGKIHVYQGKYKFGAGYVATGATALNNGAMRNREFRQNLVLQSVDLANAAWAKTYCTMTPMIAGPDGSIAANTFTDINDGGNQMHLCYQSYVCSSGKQHTLSVIAKAGTKHHLQLWGTSGPADYYCYFDLSNGTVGSYLHLDIPGRISAMWNGWYKCEITFTPTDTSVGFTICNVDGSYQYVGDGTGTMYFYQPQVEQSNSAGAYVQTTSVQYKQ